MGFFDQLLAETKEHQEALFEIPFIRRALRGDLALEGYLAFLERAYHHVRHTVPLLMATGAALPERYRWLHDGIRRYIDDEIGHEEWILSDIEAAGGDADAVRLSDPPFPCEMMVAYAYDVVHRRNPLGFFGMVHVLEGASIRGASAAAARVIDTLDLPPEAATYLTSHGQVDIDHVAFLRGLLDEIRDRDDQRFIVHCAKRFYRLYGDVFRSLPLPEGVAR